jgi:hypothetical protein
LSDPVNQALTNVFVTPYPDPFILLCHGALSVAIDSPSTEGVDVSMRRQSFFLTSTYFAE